MYKAANHNRQPATGNRQLAFTKYQGAGNDFIMIDQRVEAYLRREDQAVIERLCHRRFGIGADGLILLQNKEDYDFEMVYFNADGRESTLCGNGGRCIVAFARELGIIEGEAYFWAIDGPHRARLLDNGWVALQMQDVGAVETGEGFYYLNTGSPHYVAFVDDVAAVDVFAEGRKVRYNERFRTEGTNVNFVSPSASGIAVATYERGVEDETLACGTGVTAAALALHLHQRAGEGMRQIPIQAKGGRLEVHFRYDPATGFHDIWLHGPAERVFHGTVDGLR